jgi:hypothetical protein
MSATTTDPRAAEFSAAQDVYDRIALPFLKPEHDGRYVVVDIDHDDYEIDADHYNATARLMARRPGARLWSFRAGLPTTVEFRGVSKVSQ